MTEDRIKLLNPQTITIQDEDHTLINPLKHVIMNYNTDTVDFCGYTIPHPSDNKVNLVIQMKNENDSVLDKMSDGISQMREIFVRIQFLFNNNNKNESI